MEQSNKSDEPECQQTTTQTDEESKKVDVSNASSNYLNHRQQILYKDEINDFRQWCIDFGKDPDNREGMAPTTVENYLSRLDMCFRYLWGKLTEIGVLQIPMWAADQFITALKKDEFTKDNGKPYAEASKRKFADTLKKYYAWRSNQHGIGEWDPPYDFKDGSSRPSDPFTIDERQILREGVLKFASLPSYNDCSPDQRDRIKTYLAQALGLPKKDITPDHWRRHNQSWEKASLIYVSLDAGLRPIEVARAKIGWCRPGKMTLFIPKSDSAKNRDNWEVALKPATAKILQKWLDERKALEKYDGTDALWLTREQNPWSSSSLNGFLRKLCSDAGIATQNRKITWYSIRHSVGQYMVEEGGLDQAKEQLRHQSLESTLQYKRATIENRQNTLEKMG